YYSSLHPPSVPLHFFFQSYPAHRHLHSFPTRRSSDLISSPDQALDVMDFEPASQKAIPPAHWGYLSTGVDDDATVRANRDIVIQDRKSTRLNSSHDQISYAVFCLKKKKKHVN